MNRIRKFINSVFVLFITAQLFGQNASIKGSCIDSNGKLEYASVILSGTQFMTLSNQQGAFSLEDIPYGEYQIVASYLAHDPIYKTVKLDELNPNLIIDFEFSGQGLTLEQIVVSGTKTFKRQTESPVIVNVINSESLNSVQACNLSEGLKFQPGLRVENDCQTCNYTQLRMNGLGGGYSQILINGRPVFSPLSGLYGMEQLPVNMIDRIEVVRGGGSSLYGSSAIGGTVNVLTRTPHKDSYELNYNLQNINGSALDHQLTGNVTLVNDSENSGISLFVNHRNREWYDHNDDNFSEIPAITNTSMGLNTFFLPTDNQKLEFSLSLLNEYRFGGEMVNKEAFLTQQSEERTHEVWMGSLDYQINFNNGNTSFISYAAWQNTDRDHYTGVLPEDHTELLNHLENPPYGISDVSTYNIGIQLNHLLFDFLGGNNTLTLGAEYIYDDVLDDIPVYNYLVDQTTKNIGLFFQSDWEILPKLNLLAGIRADEHNFVKGLFISPRSSLLYKLNSNTQFRVNYSTGFRAPQAFDTDLHIAFAGGGISRVNLSPDLLPERSRSFSASINYDKPTDKYVAGFTLEGFRTSLDNAFFLDPVGEDDFGELFIKSNGQGATVQGLTLELRANYNRQLQIEGGFTIQSSQFDEAVSYIEEVEPIREFIRTPNQYGFASLNLFPIKGFSANLNYVYTGSMLVPHFAGAPNQLVDELFESSNFSEFSIKLAYELDLPKTGSKIEFYSGVKNFTNAYQQSFDIGKNRDSNFVFGPAQPRTFFLGLKLRS